MAFLTGKKVTLYLRLPTNRGESGHAERAPTIFLFKALVWTFLSFSIPQASGAIVEKKFRDPRGLSSVYAYPKLPESGTYGLMIFFHGSGGGPGYKHNLHRLKTVGKAFKLWPLAIRAPNGRNWPNTDPQKDNGFSNYVVDLLRKEVFKWPIIDSDKVVFVGWSAGSTFLAGDFLPFFGWEFKGGAVLLCGGGLPYHMGIANLKELIKNQRLYFRIGTGDFLYQQARDVANFYRDAGVWVRGKMPKESGHCSFSMETELSAGLKVLFQK